MDEEQQQRQACLAPWVELAEHLGVSRSLGQLYGLLFLLDRPLSAQDCVQSLGMSRSSVGQGLKALKELGAIKPHYKLGDRSEYFVIEPDLGVFLTKVLDGRLMPAVTSFFVEMQAVGKGVDAVAPERLQKLQRWQSKLFAALATVKEELL
jgi:DNA-binding transcriptional regulator GbsR (MarR family)